MAASGRARVALQKSRATIASSSKIDFHKFLLELLVGGGARQKPQERRKVHRKFSAHTVSVPPHHIMSASSAPLFRCLVGVWFACLLGRSSAWTWDKWDRPHATHALALIPGEGVRSCRSRSSSSSSAQLFDDLPAGYQVWLAAREYPLGMSDAAVGALVDRLHATPAMDAARDVDLMRQWIAFCDVVQISNLRSWWTKSDAFERTYRKRQFELSMTARGHASTYADEVSLLQAALVEKLNVIQWKHDEHLVAHDNAMALLDDALRRHRRDNAITRIQAAQNSFSKTRSQRHVVWDGISADDA
jgi:hypothetical protein